MQVEIPVCSVCGAEAQSLAQIGWHVHLDLQQAWCPEHASAAPVIPPEQRAEEFERHFRACYTERAITRQFYRNLRDKRLAEWEEKQRLFQQRRARIRFGLPPIQPAQDPGGR